MSRRAVGSMSGPGDQRGFSLIEVIVVVVILAILAAIAIPNYTEFVNRGRRTEAKACLLQNAQIQERRRTVDGAYGGGGAPTCPDAVTGTYTIAIITPDANSFTLTATRAGIMASDPCGDFTLNHLGVRDTVNGTRDAADCWGR